MSIILDPAIKNIDVNSLCYSIYTQLYLNFFNAQDKKDDEHPWGITEGDETSIRLRNTAYGFAEAIAGGVVGEGTGNQTGVLLDYLKKSGGDMIGLLRANYGFEAGWGNTSIIRTYSKEGNIYGVRFTGDVEIGGTNLIIGGKQLISYSSSTGIAQISNRNISFLDSVLHSQGEFIFGSNKDTGVYISPISLLVKGKGVFHAGNANLEDITWKMLDGSVAGNLSVKGESRLLGMLKACKGIELGIDDKVILSIGKDGCVNLSNNLSFASEYGVKINNISVLIRVNGDDIRLGAIGGDLLLGSEYTNRIKLLSNICDHDGDYILLSKYGAAYFPDSLTVRHNYGNNLLSSYWVDATDEGVVIHEKLRFGNSKAAFLSGKSNGICFSSLMEYSSDGIKTTSYEALLKYQLSTSKYQPLDKVSGSLAITTDADFYCFDKPIESKYHIGIDNSYTRITDGCLFFNSDVYLLASIGGIKHYGNSYFLSDIGSEKYSSGFAGSGWAVSHNKTTGNVIATFDELTIRKKMRIYELEVQKLTATNGALWISDSCSGDIVVRL